MRRLFSSTGLPAQGAVPRDFNDPATCLPVALQPDVSAPGCSSWPVTDNNYGTLPKGYPLSVSTGVAYNSFFLTVDFTPATTWTTLWAQLSAPQRAVLTESGCYCGTEGSELPTMTVGTPRPPGITPLPFFWMPPPDPAALADAMVPEGSVEESIPCQCGTGTGPAPKIEVKVVEIDGAQKLQLKLITRRPPEFQFRSDKQTEEALLQNGFPRFCCGDDKCDSTKKLLHFIEYPAWLSTVFNPYGSDPKEPLGVIPIVMDVQYDIAKGTLGLVFAHQIVHNGRIVKVNWDAKTPHSKDSYTYNDAVTEPGKGLDYNKDWLGNQLISISSAGGGACGNNCK